MQVSHPGDGNTSLSPHQISFRVFDKGGCQNQEKSRSYDDPSMVKQEAAEHVQNGMYLMNIRGHGLTEESCFDAVVNDGTYTIIVVPAENEDINRVLRALSGGSVANGSGRKNKRRRITDK